MSRDHETYETFCRHCYQKFEKKTLDEALKATELHEMACPKAPIARLS